MAEVTEALEGLSVGKVAQVNGAEVERVERQRWLVSVPGLEAQTLCVNASQAAQQALGANQRQKAGELSAVEQAQRKRDQERYRFSDLGDEELERQKDRLLDLNQQGWDVKDESAALAREMHYRTELERARPRDERFRDERRRANRARTDRVGKTARFFQAAFEDQMTLDFRSRFGRWEEAEAALQEIDQYNRFDVEKVAPALAAVFPKLGGLSIGAEGSPVIYADIPYWTNQQLGQRGGGERRRLTELERRQIGIDFLRAMRTAKADELSWQSGGGGHDFEWEQSEGTSLVRAWWD